MFFNQIGEKQFHVVSHVLILMFSGVKLRIFLCLYTSMFFWGEEDVNLRSSRIDKVYVFIYSFIIIYSS
jgi:hypothetical protein